MKQLVFVILLLAVVAAFLPASVSAQDMVTIYVEVRAGDTWSSIALRYGTTASTVRALNPGFGHMIPGALVEVPVRTRPARPMRCTSSYWPSRLCQFLPEFSGE